MRVTPLIISLALATPAVGQGMEELSSRIGVGRSDVMISSEGRVIIRGARMTLEADRVLASENLLIIEGGVISSSRRGKVLIRRARGDDPELLGALLDLPLTLNCPGTESRMSITSAVMEADQDGDLGNKGPERIAISSPALVLSRGDGCVGVVSGEIGEARATGPDGSHLILGSGVFKGGERMHLGASDVSFISPDGVTAFSAASVSASYGEDEHGKMASGELVDGRFVPASLLYDDIVSRSHIRSAEEPLRVEGSFSVLDEDGEMRISLIAHADRIGDVRLSLEAKGNVFEDPMSSALVNAEGGFRDDGGFELFRGLKGIGLPEAVRRGEGLPDMFASGRMRDVRGAVADWLENGEGSFRAEPQTPVNVMMAGAALMFGTNRLASVLNLETYQSFIETKP